MAAVIARSPPVQVILPDRTCVDWKVLAGSAHPSRVHVIVPRHRFILALGVTVSSSPSIVFSAFRSNTDPRLQGWVAFRESVQNIATPVRAVAVRDGNHAAPTLKGLPEHSGIWRLLASNSRELGRSSSVYGTFSSARAHVLELKGQCDSMVATVVTGPRAGTHGWVISVGGVVVMTAGRWYGAASTSREASTGTIEAFHGAIVAADARHATQSGQRGNRVLSEEERALAW